MKTNPHKTEGLSRPCTAHDLFSVSEGVQCGNCLALIYDYRQPTGDAMKDKIKLQPRTTYKSGDGRRVCIAGEAKREVDGKQCFWSIQGDHYTEDGLFVGGRMQDVNGERVYVPFTYELSLSNIVEEDVSEDARKWWDNVTA